MQHESYFEINGIIYNKNISDIIIKFKPGDIFEGILKKENNIVSFVNSDVYELHLSELNDDIQVIGKIYNDDQQVVDFVSKVFRHHNI